VPIESFIENQSFSKVNFVSTDQVLLAQKINKTKRTKNQPNKKLAEGQQTKKKTGKIYLKNNMLFLLQ
jgi:hypothetical protein